MTAGVDIQHDRIEYEVVAWGVGEESWNIDYRVIYGDTSGDDVWEELEEDLATTYEHESGAMMHINCVVVDSGDRTQRVYDYVRTTRHSRVFAGKGITGEGRPVAKLSRRTKGRNRRAVDLYQIGVDDAKSILFARLKMEAEGPGYCHFPMQRDVEYFDQLTAEKRVMKKTRGFERPQWEKIRPRNEALDCRVYAFAALKILNPIWSSLERRLGRGPTRSKTERAKQAPSPRRKPSRGIGGNDWGGRL